MSDQPKWWAKRPGRWESSLEDALASGRAVSIGLAWAIILVTGGDRPGCIAEFCRRAGVSEPAVDNGLKGRSFGPRQRARVVAKTGLREDLFSRGEHPYSLGAHSQGSRIEPGNRLWAGMWQIMADNDPGMLSVSELRQNHPKLFPDVT